MSVDFDAIAQRGRCEVSSLRLAQPLIEQGYSPPFLSRYRRDELGGIDEASLWALSAAIRNEQDIATRKEKLHLAWKQTPLVDPAIGHAIENAGSVRVLARLARRLKGESSTAPSDSVRLAVRVLNPKKDDGEDFAEIAGKVESISDAAAAVAGLDDSLAQRLPDDPRIVAAAVRWLAKHAQIKIAKIHDPHLEANSQKNQKQAAELVKSEPGKSEPAKSESPTATAAETIATDSAKAADSSPGVLNASAEEASVDGSETATEPTAEATEAAATEPTAVEPVSPEAVSAEPAEKVTADSPDAAVTEAVKPETGSSSDSPADSSAVPAETPAADPSAGETKPAETKPAESKPAAKKEKKAAKKSEVKKAPKKVSPRQRRRRWLVSVLKPLQGKKFSGDKLSAFQIVMLGRALRSQVAICQFEYDAAKLVAELQRTAVGFNRVAEEKLKEVVLQNEALIRDAAEAAWWDDLQERASARLVAVTADTLRSHVNRGAVDAKVVLSIDAVGPRTAATTIVSADGRLLHCEDLPCQLSTAQRSAAVARMGELIHSHHVDLIVISNGPARRSMMVAVGDLIKQSPEKSVRWTLAERGGADAYSSSSVADQEMRSTPRRFRSAAWLAMSVLQPAQAMAKVDPLKLRLSSFQRELSEEALAPVLENIMVSGASRGGVDVNSAPQSWLARLPGMTDVTAAAIDTARRKELFQSREAILELEGWTSESEGRQALPFLRVFGSEETLDGTLIHPGDYAIARKLATTLKIDLPPASPPGYETPDYSSASSTAAAEVRPMEVVQKDEKPVVEEFTASGEKSPEFSINDDAKEPVADAADSPASEPVAEEPPTEAGDAEPKDADASQAAASEGTVNDEPANDEPASEVAASEETATETADAQVESSPAAAEVTHDPIKHPLPEKAAVDKCIKEWQIGAQRTYQIVHWLCDPFGDSDVSGTPPAVLTKVPSMKDLKKGDQVIGVVVGVMPFGVFVELAPDCSGLVHVSRVSDTFVEDLHEAVQVGDVVTAWVTGIDEKKRRVGLSALSPEREAELEQARRNQRSGGRGQGGGNRGGQNRGSQSRGSQNRSAPNRGGGPGGRGGVGRSGKPGGGGNRGGQGRDSRGGRGREKRVESYRVVSKKEEKPLTEKMAKGEEPMRSFGDLAQFLGTGKPAAPKKPAKKKTPPAAKPAPTKTEASSSESKPADSSVAQQPPADEQVPGNDQASVAKQPPAANESPAAESAPPAEQDANEDSSKS